MRRSPSIHALFLASAVLVTGCTAKPAVESDGARQVPGAPSLAGLHAALSAPGAIAPPPFAVDYFVHEDEDEIPEEAVSISVDIVDFAEGDEVEGYARKRIVEAIEELRTDPDEQVGELLFLLDNSDIEWSVQVGGEVQARLLEAVADPAVRTTVKTILDEGASYFRFQSVDDSAELQAKELLIVQPAVDDARNRALVIERGCCGGY